MRISDWSSDVCSSDRGMKLHAMNGQAGMAEAHDHRIIAGGVDDEFRRNVLHHKTMVASGGKGGGETFKKPGPVMAYGRGLSMHQPPAHDFPAEMLRSEEHTSELQSLMRISYAVFCLKKKLHHYSQYYRTIKTTHQSQT